MKQFVANALGLTGRTSNMINITLKPFEFIKIEQEVDEFTKEKVIKIVTILKKYCDIWETQTRGKTLEKLSKLRRFFMQTTDINKINIRYSYVMAIEILSWKMPIQNALWSIQIPKQIIETDELDADRNIFYNNFRDLLDALTGIDKDDGFHEVVAAKLIKYKDNNSLLQSDLKTHILMLEDIVVEEHRILQIYREQATK